MARGSAETFGDGFNTQVTALDMTGVLGTGELTINPQARRNSI
jgi:hypothetical protein